MFAPCVTAAGPPDAHLAIVGEAPGEEEELTGLPFMGRAGQLLTTLLREAGIERRDCYLTNVLFTRPPGNNLETFLVKRTAPSEGHTLPPVKPGGYLHSELYCEIDRLRQELSAVRPNLILALGNTAAWALLGRSGIGSIRGTIAGSSLVPGLKVLPTYHPAGVLRQWAWRPIVIADLLKARHEMAFPEIRRPERAVVVSPTLQEVRSFCREAHAYQPISVDVETWRRQITMVGIATTPSHALVVPFVDWSRPGGHYWQTLEEEVTAWDEVARLLQSHPMVVMQNGMYDVQYLWHMGIPVPGFAEDTMLLHHALYPEMPKGLGFLGSIYTNEASWKLMRHRGDQSNKREE